MFLFLLLQYLACVLWKLHLSNPIFCFERNTDRLHLRVGSIFRHLVILENDCNFFEFRDLFHFQRSWHSDLNGKRSRSLSYFLLVVVEYVLSQLNDVLFLKMMLFSLAFHLYIFIIKADSVEASSPISLSALLLRLRLSVVGAQTGLIFVRPMSLMSIYPSTVCLCSFPC